MLFDIKYGWRKWQGQRLKLITFVLGLSMFTALITITLNLFNTINNDRPIWVNSDKHLITVASKSIGGSIKPETRFNIELLNKIPNIDEVASIKFEKATVRLFNKSFNDVSIAFYSQELISLLKLNPPFNKRSFENNEVFLGHNFYKKNFRETFLKDGILTLKKQQLPIAGLLPSSMDRINQHNIDLWIPDSFLSLYVPKIVENTKLYLNSEPRYFGIASFEKMSSTQEIQSQYEQLLKENPNFDGVFIKQNNSPWIIKGLELDPTAKTILLIQCWTLIFLIMGFGFIIFTALFSFYSQQFIDRKNEYALKVTLGGNRMHLAKKTVLENLFIIIGVTIISIIFIVVIKQTLQEGVLYKRYFNDEFAINWWSWVIALLTTKLFFIFCTLFPLININNQQLFDRSEQGSRSKKQTLLSVINLVVQLAIVIVTLIFTFNIFAQEWQNQQIKNVNGETDVFSVEQSGHSKVYLNEQQKNGVWQNNSNVDIAFASTPFNSLDDTSITYQSAYSNNNTINSTTGSYVSGNYFRVTGISSLTPINFVKNTIVINESMALILKKQGIIQPNAPISSLLGVPLTINSFPSKFEFPIAGIVSNAPHFGTSKTNPVIYLHYANFSNFISGRLAPYFFAKTGHQKEVSDSIKSWLQNETTGLSSKLSISTIKALVFKLNLGGRLLFITSGFMAMLITLLLAITLFYDIQSNLNKEKSKYGVMLALGMSKGVFQRKIIKQYAIAIILATPVSFYGLSKLDLMINEFLKLNLLNINYYLMAIGIIFLLIISFGILLTQRLLNKPINQLLNQKQ